MSVAFLVWRQNGTRLTNAGGVWLFSDTDSIAVVASPNGGTVYPKRPEEEC